MGSIREDAEKWETRPGVQNPFNKSISCSGAASEGAHGPSFVPPSRQSAHRVDVGLEARVVQRCSIDMIDASHPGLFEDEEARHLYLVVMARLRHWDNTMGCRREQDTKMVEHGKRKQ